MTVSELELAIQYALSVGQAPAEANRFRVSDLKNSLNEFFESLEEQSGRSLSKASTAHETVFVMDADPTKEASFVVVTASPDVVELAVGHGNADEVSALTPRELLERHAGNAVTARTPRQTLVAWSGYDPE